MRREVLIIAGVLVPFSVLVALAFRSSRDLPAQGVPDGGGERALRTPAKTTAIAADDAGTPPAPVEALRPRWLSDTLNSAVKTCLTDQAHGSMRVTLTVTPTRAGRFEAVTPDTQDPYLSACLSDVFEEAEWSPSPQATESFAPTRHTFSFESRKD